MILDLERWYDDMMIFIFQKTHSGCTVDLFFRVVRENVGEAGWEAIPILWVSGDGSSDYDEKLRKVDEFKKL